MNDNEEIEMSHHEVITAKRNLAAARLALAVSGSIVTSCEGNGTTDPALATADPDSQVGGPRPSMTIGSLAIQNSEEVLAAPAHFPSRARARISLSPQSPTG